MRQVHYHLLCIAGVLQVVVSVVQSAPHAYHFITSPMTWTEAKKHCEKTYTDLAVVVSYCDWIKFQMEAQSKALSSNAWVGLFNDINSWRWSFSNTMLAESFWYQGQPDNQAGHQSCGSVDTSGYWWDDVCSTLKPFLCFNAMYNDSNKYIWISSPMTWHEAQAYCRAKYTDLASVTSTADTNLLKAKVLDRSWFGLFRNSWRWVDGTNASSISWINGYPNNYGTCAYYQQSSSQVADYNCNVPLVFFCHSSSPASERQIIEVKVKTDRNIYDPQLDSDMLEMMQQKLEDLGMPENSTLSWRIRQDGNIFQQREEEAVEGVSNTALIVCKS